MSDSLSGLLVGLNQGVRTGLDLYTAVEGQKRAQRQEDRQAALDATEAKRYAEERQYRADQASLSQANNERDFGLRQDQFGLQKDTLAFNQKRALANDDAAERRHQETLALSRLRLNAASATQRAKAGAAYTKQLGGLTTELGKAFQGEKGVENFATLANTHVNYRVALADKLGFQISPDDLQNVRIIPAGNQYLLAKLDQHGQPTMWDPDGDGKPGYAIPTRVAALAVGGATAAESADVGNTRVSLAQGADQAAKGIASQATGLGQTLDARQKDVEQAKFAQEFEATGPRAEFIRQQNAAREGADVSQFDGARTYIDPSTGRVVQLPSGPASLAGVPKVRQAEAEQRAALAQTGASLATAERSADLTQQRIDELPKQAKSLREGWAAVEQKVRTLPFNEQQTAYENAAGTFDAAPMLAARYPGKGLTEASNLARKERGAFVDKVVGAVDLKTQEDFKGKPQNLSGGKANLRSVLLSMPDEVWMSLSDHTGQMEGALQKAVQGAADAGKPEAVPYLLYADKLGLDSQAAVTLMQDTALASVKDPNQRFTYAAKAMELVKSGKADSAEAGLGMVIQGR